MKNLFRPTIFHCIPNNFEKLKMQWYKINLINKLTNNPEK